VAIARIAKESSWTVWKEILNNLVITFILGLVNYLYYCWYDDAAVELLPLLYFQLMTLEVGIVPFTIFALVRQHQLVRKYQAESERIREEIPYRRKATEEEDQDGLIKLQAQHQKNDFTCRRGELLFLAARENYIIIHFLDQGALNKEMIRSTMKKATGELQMYPEFFRCHKSYLVNLTKVESVSGNAQGLKLHLERVEEIIPVSRNLTASLNEKLRLVPVRH